MSSQIRYLDGNASGGELSKVFAVDITGAQSQCVNCGATRPFAEAHLYMECPGLVARCCVCGAVLLRVVTAPRSTWLDVRGLTYLRLVTRE